MQAATQDEREYTIPEGCIVCGSDLPVKVTAAGPRGVCKHCGWFGRPTVTVTQKGLRVDHDLAKA